MVSILIEVRGIKTPILKYLTYKGNMGIFRWKTKGLIVTFRKPSTMEQNVKNATKLYSQAQEESSLVYRTYDESKKRFKKAHKALITLVPNPTDIDENTSLETRIEFEKAFQEG